MAKKLRECRSCKRLFRSGGTHGCCTSFCYDKVGPYPETNTNNISVTVLGGAPRRERKRNKQRSNKDGFYLTREWLEIRYDVLRSYGRVCMLCGELRGQMHVDHIEPRSKRPDLQLVFSNLQVLCKNCNKGKSNRDNTDFRLEKKERPLAKSILRKTNNSS